jgi:hypothetical protein
MRWSNIKKFPLVFDAFRGMGERSAGDMLERRGPDYRFPSNFSFLANAHLAERNMPQMFGSQNFCEPCSASPQARFGAAQAYSLNPPVPASNPSAAIASHAALQQGLLDNMDLLNQGLSSMNIRAQPSTINMPGPVHFREGDTAEDMFAMYIFKVS